MARFRRLLVCLLAMLWLPATLHCAMDRAGLFESAPACCGHEKTTNAADAGRCDERCPTFERIVNPSSGDNSLTPGAPALIAFVGWFAVTVDVSTIPVSVSPPETDAPLEVARTWHFAARAARPARAPSFA
jgi:hypothetical protein